jgi:hypothetical protein
LGLVLLVLDEKQTFDALQQSRMTFELVDEHQTGWGGDYQEYDDEGFM